MSAIARYLNSVILAGLGVLIISAGVEQAPAHAQAQRPNGYPVTNVNLRAGPGTYYPVITVVPTHAPISIVGCLGDYTWCDVLFRGNRGWMRSIYLKKWYQGHYYALGDYAPRLAISVVSFDIGNYWDSNYRDRPFYREKARWGGSYGEGWTNRGVFYRRLAPYGDWIWLNGQYVWVPDVGPRWRPYTAGRWAYTDRYGWMWVSDEPFGWAVYHYGRWGYSNRVGWFWVPGHRWAPAWVSWRRSDNYLAWAPLPPVADEGLGINIKINIGTIPDYYWQAVPDQYFLADDLERRVVWDRRRIDPILRETRPLGNVTVVNNTTVVNNVVNINYIEQKTKKKVVVHKVERTKDEKKAGKAKGNAIEVFEPATDQEAAVAAPPEVKPIDEVAKESKTKGQVESAKSTEDLLVPEEIKALPAPGAEGTSGKSKEGAPATAETTPPPPPPPAEGEPVAEEAAPPPPPAPQDTPPPPPTEETPPPPAAAEQPAPPPPATEEKSTPPASPAAEEALPPPPPAEEAPPPPAGEEAPPSPPPAEEEPAAKPKQEQKKQKDEKPKKEKPKPAETQAPPPPPPPQDDAPLPPPPPAEESAPPPPVPAGEEAPKAKKDGKPKKEKGNGQPGGPPPSFEQEPMGETLPPPSSADAPSKKKDGKQGGKQNGKQKKGKGDAPGEPCPEGMMQMDDGSCAPMQ